MKLLMFQARHFTCLLPPRSALSAPASGALDAVPGTPPAEQTVNDVVVVFVHAEPADTEHEASLLRKAAKNIKWLANKRGWRQVVLHSFAHLAEEKAPATFGDAFLGQLAGKLSNAGYEVRVTPYGASLQWDLGVYEEPLAKVYKSL